MTWSASGRQTVAQQASWMDPLKIAQAFCCCCGQHTTQIGRQHPNTEVAHNALHNAEPLNYENNRLVFRDLVPQGVVVGTVVSGTINKGEPLVVCVWSSLDGNR